MTKDGGIGEAVQESEQAALTAINSGLCWLPLLWFDLGVLWGGVNYLHSQDAVEHSVLFIRIHISCTYSFL